MKSQEHFQIKSPLVEIKLLFFFHWSVFFYILFLLNFTLLMILLLFLLLWIRHVDRLLFSNPCCLRTSHRIYVRHQSVRFLVKKKSDPGIFVHHLGVVISKNEQDRVSLNFNPAFEKIKNSL